MLESLLQQQIRLAISTPSTRFFRNNVGSAKLDDGRFIQFGLCKGSSDLIGYVSKEITQEMVGQRVAVFAALEVKTKTGRVSPEQHAFIARVTADGGIAGVVRSTQEAVALCQ